MDASLALLIVLPIVTALVLGLVIHLLVELARGRGVPALEAARRRFPVPGGPTTLQRLAADTRDQVARTQEAVDRATARGLPVAQLRQVMAQLAEHGVRLEEQAAFVQQAPRVRSANDSLARLEEQHAEVAAVCERIRSGLAEDELSDSALELRAIIDLAEVEVDALWLGRDPFAARPPAQASGPNPDR